MTCKPTWRLQLASRVVSHVKLCVCNTNRCVCVCVNPSAAAPRKGPHPAVYSSKSAAGRSPRVISGAAGLHSPLARCAADCQLGPAPPAWVPLSPAAGVTPRRLGLRAASPCVLSSPSHTVVPPPPPPPASASAQRAWRCCCWCPPPLPSAEAHHQKVEMMPSWTRLCWSWATHSDTHIRLRISCSRSLR